MKTTAHHSLQLGILATVLLLAGCAKREWIHPSLPNSTLPIDESKCVQQTARSMGPKPRRMELIGCRGDLAKTVYCQQLKAQVDTQNAMVTAWETGLRTGTERCLVAKGWRTVRVNNDGQLLDENGDPVGSFNEYVDALEASKAKVRDADKLVVPEHGDADWDTPRKKASVDTSADPELVKRVQTRLNALGFKAGNPDGKFGPKTRSALEAFQANAGLPTSGNMDRKTLDYLLE